MIESIFESIGDAVNGFVTVLADGLTKITSLIYTPGTSGNPGSLTTFGVLLLIGSGVALVYWVFKMIRSLVKVKA